MSSQFRLGLLEGQCRLISEQASDDGPIWAAMERLAVFVSKLASNLAYEIARLPLSINTRALSIEARSLLADNFRNLNGDDFSHRGDTDTIGRVW